MYDFGELLRQLRTERGYTQAQLAKKLNKSKSIICKYESGQKLPSLETLIDISSLFNVSLDYLTNLDKRKTISINNLTDTQAAIIHTLINEFTNKKNYRQFELSGVQLNIINSILKEFLN